MNPPVLTTFGNPDPNANPINITGLVQLLKTLVSSEIQGSYIPYVLSAQTPGVPDQDKAWIQQDNVGRPIAVKIFYNGNWRRVYNGMLGEIRMYNGNPANDFDANGLGNVGASYDGWHICNGLDGTPDLTDVFPVGAHMNNSNGQVGYNSGWQTFVDGIAVHQTGGSPSRIIAPSDLPPLDFPAQSSKLTIHGAEYKGDVTQTFTKVLVDTHWGNLLTHDLVVANYGSGPNDAPPVPQTPIPTLPPYQALAFIIFVGYA